MVDQAAITSLLRLPILVSYQDPKRTLAAFATTDLSPTRYVHSYFQGELHISCDQRKERQFRILNDTLEGCGIKVVRLGTQHPIDVKDLLVGDFSLLEPDEGTPRYSILPSDRSCHQVRRAQHSWETERYQECW